MDVLDLTEVWSTSRELTDEDLMDRYLAAQNQHHFGCNEGGHRYSRARREGLRAYARPPAKGSPFAELPVEIKAHIFRFLGNGALAKLCLTSRRLLDEIRPFMHRHLHFDQWFQLLRVARTLLAQDDLRWKRQALSQFRHMDLVTPCFASLNGDHDAIDTNPKSFLYRRRRTTQRQFITEEVQETLTNLVRQAPRIESFHWGACRAPSTFENLFKALDRHPIQSLLLADRCHMAPDPDSWYFYGQIEPAVPLMDVPGWGFLQNLHHLTELELAGYVKAGKSSRSATSQSLDDLLARCPNLTTLGLRFLPRLPGQSAWLVLQRLDEYHWPNLSLLTLEFAAAPSREALRAFLARHQALTDLCWKGVPWADDTFTHDAVATHLSRRGTFTVEADAAIALPRLKRLCVSSMRLQSAILAGSSPDAVEQALLVPNPSKTYVLDGAFEIDYLYYQDLDPMPALANATGLLELSVVIPGYCGVCDWAVRVAQLLEKLPPSLIVLSIRTPGLTRYNTDDVYGGSSEEPVSLPIRFPTHALSHLENLRLLVLPHECIYDEERWRVSMGFTMDEECAFADEVDRHEYIDIHCQRLCTSLARQNPRLDAIWFLGTETVDSFGHPMNVFRWRPFPWPSQMCYSVEVIRPDPLPPTLMEQERIKIGDSFSTSLDILARLPFHRDRITELDTDETRELKEAPIDPKNENAKPPPANPKNETARTAVPEDKQLGPSEGKDPEAKAMPPAAPTATRKNPPRTARTKRQAPADVTTSGPGPSKKGKTGQHGKQGKTRRKESKPPFRLRYTSQACCCTVCYMREDAKYDSANCNTGAETSELQRRYTNTYGYNVY